MRYWIVSNHLRCGALIIFFIMAPQTILAHAFPDRSEPRVGATIATSPPSVRIWFDGALESSFSKITVQDGNGTGVDNGGGRVDPTDPTLLEVELPLLPRGTYRVIWDVLARDGHRTKGDFTFTVK